MGNARPVGTAAGSVPTACTCRGVFVVGTGRQNEMAVNDHSPLAPSSAHIWAPENGCRGSVALQQAYPSPEDSPEAREGVAAHWYVAELLNGRDVPVGAVAPNGHPVSAEMVDCAQDILVDIRDTLRAAHSHDLRVEQRVMAASVHEASYGTPDVYLMDRAQKILHVWDYKYGHRFVDANRNWQLLNYAIAILDMEGFSPDVAYDHPQSWHGWRITLTIAQPRNYSSVGPLREWYLSGEGLRDTYLPQLRRAAHEAMQPGAPYTTGEHCRDCSGRHVCPALQRAGALAMDVSLQAQPVQLPPHAVGLELRQINDAIKRLEARKTGLEEQALAIIRGGTGVPFFTAEHSSGREDWQVPAAQVIALGEIFGVSLRKEATLTPTQARKAGIPDEAFVGWTARPSGALRLKPVDDNAAKLAFEQE